MSDISAAAMWQGKLQMNSGADLTAKQGESKDLALRFEKMLWSEMLSHAGLEEAFTKSGGQAASAFSQYMVEAIAEDLAQRHPLGFDPVGDATDSVVQATDGEVKE